ncbi:MAG: hypothetical protein R6U92_00800, partial [Bacillota bacterium]
ENLDHITADQTLVYFTGFGWHNLSTSPRFRRTLRAEICSTPVLRRGAKFRCPRAISLQRKSRLMGFDASREICATRFRVASTLAGGELLIVFHPDGIVNVRAPSLAQDVRPNPEKLT